jgi:hypothetical protein
MTAAVLAGRRRSLGIAPQNERKVMIVAALSI